MEFKKISTRAIILISSAALLLFITFLVNQRPKSKEIFDDQISATAPLPAVIKQPEMVKSLSNFETDDEAAQKEMKDQMDTDRNQQRQIKMLKMQFEQVNLQLENEKAMAEINKLKREGASYVKDSNPQGPGFPSIKIIYIGGAETKKEAILSIAGTSYSVKEKDKPVENVEILSITNNSVKAHFSAPQEKTTMINYAQE